MLRAVVVHVEWTSPGGLSDYVDPATPVFLCQRRGRGIPSRSA